jgi:hypothetical protein
MLTPVKNEMELSQDIVHEARQFRTLLAGFNRNVELLYENQGVKPNIDSVAMAKAFAKWRQAFDATRHLANQNRADFVVFSAGLMLKELLLAKPMGAPPQLLGEAALVEQSFAQWPEGYAYASFCLSVATAVLDRMGEGREINQKLADDPAFWNSFRENTAEDASNAIAYFDLLCGVEPNWNGPDVPWFRPAFKNKKLLENQ